MTSVPTTPVKGDDTSQGFSSSPLSDLSMNTDEFYPISPAEMLSSAANSTQAGLSLPLFEYSSGSRAVDAVLYNPQLLHRILSFIYDAPSDYKKGSHLIDLNENEESYSFFQLFELQCMCRDWYNIINSCVIPFRNPVLAKGGDNHRLHIPFLTWLGATMQVLAFDPIVPRTNFSLLIGFVESAVAAIDGFAATDYISEPAVSKIWLCFQADYHPPFTRYYHKNPNRKARKPVCCPIGDYIDALEFSLQLRDRPKGKRDRIMEDAFIVRNDKGVTIMDVVEHMTEVLAGYYRTKRLYMLWMIEIGFCAGITDQPGERDMNKRIKQTLFEVCNRSARIFLTDSRLEIKNEHRINFQPPRYYDPLHDPSEQNKNNDTKLSLRRGRDSIDYEEDSEQEENVKEESDDDDAENDAEKGANKGGGEESDDSAEREFHKLYITNNIA